MLIPDHIEKKLEYQQFVEWMGLPAPERVPKEQKELAQTLGVSEPTLSNWKQEEGFWAIVRDERLKWLKNKVGNVLYGLYGKAMKGDAAEVKLFLEMAEEYEEKLKITGKFKLKEELKLTDEDKELIKQALDYGGLTNNTRKDT